MRKDYLILIVLLLGITISGIAQENNGYMTLVASQPSGITPDGSNTAPRDGTINVPGNEYGIISGEEYVTTPGSETASMVGNRFKTVPGDGSIREGFIDSYLELKRGVDENVAQPENWIANTRIGLTNEEVAKMIVISPNPVVDRFHLKVPAEVGEVKQAGFYNLDGRRVRSFGSHIGGGKDRDLEMDATDLIPGLYFLRIENEAGIISKSFEVLDI